MNLHVDQMYLPAEKRFSEALFRRIATAAESHVHIPDGDMNLRFVSDAEMQRLNRMYRGKDKTTDVLSFSYIEDVQEGMPIEELGDIIISYDQAERQAEGDIELEVVDLIVHGILHVLGYDHEEAQDAEVMFPLQDAIVGKVL